MTAIRIARPCRDRAQQRHADGAGNREPEFPALNAINPAQVGELEKPDRRCDHYRGQRAGGQVPKQDRRYQQQQGTASAPTTPVSCVLAPAASATGVRDELLLIGKP